MIRRRKEAESNDDGGDDGRDKGDIYATCVPLLSMKLSFKELIFVMETSVSGT